MSRAGAAIAKRQWDRLEEARLGGIRHKGAVERDARLSTAMATWRSGAVASLLVPGSLPLGLGPGRLYHGDIAAWTSHALNPRAGQREGGRGSLLHEPVENDGGADRNDDGGDAGGKKRAHSSLHSFGPHPADYCRMAGLSRAGRPAHDFGDLRLYVRNVFWTDTPRPTLSDSGYPQLAFSTASSRTALERPSARRL
jgi:hypothetical protein